MVEDTWLPLPIHSLLPLEVNNYSPKSNVVIPMHFFMFTTCVCITKQYVELFLSIEKP